MDLVFILLPFAVLLAIAGLAGFVWAVKTGQFDDLETPAMRVLFDDDPVMNGGGGTNLPKSPDSPSQKLSDRV